MGLHIEVSGSGPDLVLLHGWGTLATVWDEMAFHLLPHFRVHGVTLPSHGASPAYRPYTLDAIADALADALPPRVSVCGWSLGGQIALTWALRKPRQIERLVLIATTPRFVKGAQWECGIDGAVLDAFAPDLVDEPRATLQRFFALQTQGDADARTVLRRLRGRMVAHGATDVATLAAQLRLLQQTDLRDRLPQVTQPALILHGERDPIVPLAAGAYLQRALPRAALEVCAGAAHAPFIAQPQRIARRIAEFCNGQ